MKQRDVTLNEASNPRRWHVLALPGVAQFMLILDFNNLSPQRQCEDVPAGTSCRSTAEPEFIHGDLGMPEGRRSPGASSTPAAVSANRFAAPG